MWLALKFGKQVYLKSEINLLERNKVNHFDEDVDRRVFRDDIPSAFWEERRTN
jgi:hypothetical protein